MADSARKDSGADKRPKTNSKREVKILMLHGYTQSGPVFRAKTRALEKLMAKALAPAGLVPALLYPTAPNRLSPRDIPGWERAPDGSDHEADDDDEQSIDAWAWFRMDRATGEYRLLREGMMRIAETIAAAAAAAESLPSPSFQGEEEDASSDVIDGVIGFSQGGCMAGMLAAAMDPARPVPAGEGENNDSDWDWVRALRAANRGRGLRFAAIYSGFYAVPPVLSWLYVPRIATPTLHVLGGLDTVVEESRSQGLVERCQDPVVVVHPGGHYVPVSREWATPLIGFIRQCMEAQSKL